VVEILSDYALDPVTAYVVFPAGRRKGRARFSDYLEQALAAIGEETAPSRDKAAILSRRPTPSHPLRNAEA
jgi:hypothetical protein